MDGNKLKIDSDGPDEAWPLCTNCVTPCDPKLYYCPTCNSNEAINPLTPYIPLVSIRYDTGVIGKIWRKCRYGDDASIAVRFFCLMIVLLLFPYYIVFSIPFWLIKKISNQKIRKRAEVSVYIFFALLFCFYFIMLVMN